MDDRELGRLAERDYQTWVEGFADSPGVTVTPHRPVRRAGRTCATST